MKRYFTIDRDYNIKTIKTKPDINKINSTKNFSVVNYLNIGYYIITPILIGVFLGLYLEDKFQSKGKIALIMILLGTVASFFNIWKIYKTISIK